MIRRAHLAPLPLLLLALPLLFASSFVAVADDVVLRLDGGKLAVSVDGGASWKPCALPEGDALLALTPSGPAAFALVRRGSAIHRLDLAGGAWRDGGPVLGDWRPSWTIRVLRRRGALVAMGQQPSKHPVYASTTDGRAWTPVARADVSWVQQDAGLKALVASARAFARTKPSSRNVNDAEVWAPPAKEGQGAPLVAYAMAFGNAGPRMPHSDRRWLSTTDGGATWGELTLPEGLWLHAIEAVDGRPALLIARGATGHSVSADGGKTWSAQAGTADPVYRVYGGAAWRRWVPMRRP